MNIKIIFFLMTFSFFSQAENERRQIEKIEMDIKKINSTLSPQVLPCSEQMSPTKEVSDGPFHLLAYKSNAEGIEEGRKEDGEIVEAFQFKNIGPNSIVDSTLTKRRRTFLFDYMEQARSDMKLIISDSLDNKTSHETYSVMVFFPRLLLPTIKRVGEVLVVTLTNGEVTKFNFKTKEIISGVLKEKPQAKYPNGKARPVSIEYTGEGVLIRADKTGDLPYGDIELENGKNAPSISVATISKKGFKDCKVPSKDIWYTDHHKGGVNFIRNELSTDIGFNLFIKSRCGFSL